MTNIRKKFSWRAFVSIALSYSFIIIFLTGIVLYLSPAGRVAHWVNWKFAGFSKEEWQAIHTNFTYFFVILSIFHLFSINWKAFWSYLKGKSKSGINKKREFYIATVLSIAMFFGIIFSIPPFSSVMDLGNYLSASWENNDTQPPIPHAELLNLIEVSERLENMPIEKIEAKLKAHKINFDHVSQTLAQIAESNGLNPNQIYQIIIKQSQAGQPGSGMGKKTLEDLATENNKDVNSFISLLKAKNIDATKDQTLKQLADTYDMAAKDLYAIILGENK